MIDFEKIKQEILNNPTYFLYQLTKTKEIFLCKGSSKTEVKEKLAEKVAASSDKLKKCDLVLLYITFQEADNEFIFGDLLVRIVHYKLENSKIVGINEDHTKYVWFPKKYIEIHGWNKDYLKQIAKVVNQGKVEFNILSMPSYLSIEDE
jgi:hypothetical protein